MTRQGEVTTQPASFDRIVVILNPQSTGAGSQLAEELHADLARAAARRPVITGPSAPQRGSTPSDQASAVAAPGLQHAQGIEIDDR